MIMLTLWAVLLPLQITRITSLQVTPVPYGVVTLKQGEARTSTQAYEVVFLRSHPRHVRRTLLRSLEEKAEDLLALIDLTNPAEAQLYRTRLTDLRARPRRRRGLIDGVSELSRILFGFATDRDVTAIRSKVNELVASRNAEQIIVSDLIVCYNDTVHEQKKVRSKVNEMIGLINDVSADFSYLANVTDYLAARVRHVELRILLENIVSYLDFYKTQQSTYDRLFQYHRDSAAIGHLTESLVTRRMLDKLRKEIKFELSDDFLYKNLQIRIMKFDRQQLGFWFTIPILNEEVYAAWKLVTVEFSDPTSRTIQKVEPENTQVAVGLTSGKIISTSQCQYSNPIICASPVEFNDLPCVHGMLAKNPDLLSQCSVILSAVGGGTRVKRLSPTQLLISTDRNPIEERCESGRSLTYELNAGTYILDSAPGCTIEGPRGTFAFHAMRIHTHTVEVREIQLLDDLNVTFKIPAAISVRAPTGKGNLSLLTGNELRGPVVHVLPPLRVVYRSGAIAGLVACVISLCVCIGLMIYIVYRKYVRVKPEQPSKLTKKSVPKSATTSLDITEETEQKAML